VEAINRGETKYTSVTGTQRELISLYKARGTTIDLCNVTNVLKARGLLVEQAEDRQGGTGPAQHRVCSRRGHDPAAAFGCAA
jgi:hypothetical protein